MADGTIRVQIDIDPPYRRAFFASFSEIDMPVALAPLKPNAVNAQPDPSAPPLPPEKPKDPPGPLCKLAAIWCGTPQFGPWLAEVHKECWEASNGVTWQERNADCLRAVCGIESRRDLDTDLEARDYFDAYVRAPFSQRLKDLESTNGF